MSYMRSKNKLPQMVRHATARIMTKQVSRAPEISGTKTKYSAID